MSREEPKPSPEVTDEDADYQITIHVQTQYLEEQSSPAENRYAFAYTIRIENTGKGAAQLISRRWLIVDANGLRQEVHGLGVVGHQPLLEPGQQFEYSSSAQIATPVGTMSGSYFFVSDVDIRFDTPIPEFALRNPRSLH